MELPYGDSQIPPLAERYPEILSEVFSISEMVMLRESMLEGTAPDGWTERYISANDPILKFIATRDESTAVMVSPFIWLHFIFCLRVNNYLTDDEISDICNAAEIRPEIIEDYEAQQLSDLLVRTEEALANDAFSEWHGDDTTIFWKLTNGVLGCTRIYQGKCTLTQFEMLNERPVGISASITDAGADYMMEAVIVGGTHEVLRDDQLVEKALEVIDNINYADIEVFPTIEFLAMMETSDGTDDTEVSLVH